ncbi:MAG: TIGR01212 family radical SAM protein [Lachnospiraceae bacterium]|nr:TIGR01212 family radical SAM protein [Lachnospiraceae bacterium]
MDNKKLYNKYSIYLKKKYGEKVYKLPINLPITCPNRVHGSGCTFCSELGTGFEAMDSMNSVKEQLLYTKSKILKKYNAKKYIAYFQNYTNTFMPLEQFKTYMLEAATVEDIVELSISTRPDCISENYLDILEEIHKEFKINITIELGLQTSNHRALKAINRGHSLAEFIDAVLLIKKYNFTITTHIILNLPYDDIEDNIETAKIISALSIDIIKIHSLYIAKNTLLCESYDNGTITLCSKEEYIHRLITFLEYLNPEMIVERLFSRVPKEEAVFSNWETSWWKLQDEVIEKMNQNDCYQGKKFDYLHGHALRGI